MCGAIALLAMGASVTPGTSAPPGASATPAGAADEVTLTYRHRLELPARGFGVEFVRVKDDRCPKEVACIWAGHAAVTLKITRAGQPPQTIVIGTRAPAGMNLPFEAEAASHRFSLVTLEPQNSQDAPPRAKAYRVRVWVAPL